MTTALPANLILRLVADLLHARLERLDSQLRRNPHRAPAGRQDRRRETLAHIKAQGRALRTLRGVGIVPAETAALLLAWAGGHLDAIAELEVLDPRVEGLEAKDYVGACRLLLGAREG